MSTCELLTMAALLAAGTCVAGEIAVPYDTIRDIPRLKAFKGRNCEFCNVGSNSGLFGFDWESAGVNGANFATGPQSLAQGFALLEHFADRLAAGCTVFIPICPFSSISVPDRYGPERQYKIYPFMRGEDIYLWTPERAAAVAKAVDEAEAKWTGCDSRLVEPDKAVTPEAFRRSVESLLACWRRDFEIDDFAAPLSDRNRAAFAANAEVFRKGLETCRARGWRPIVVLPPVSRYYDAVFPDKVWRQYVDDFVAAAHVKGVPYWDYSRDERFREEANFRNSLMLNRRGSALFTKELVRRAKGGFPYAAFRQELRAFYPDWGQGGHDVVKDPRQPQSYEAIRKELADWCSAHPGYDALDVRRECYLSIRRHFVPFLFKESPFYFEAGVNGGWGGKRPARLVNEFCNRFYEEQNLVPKESFALLKRRQGENLALSCGPFVDDMHHVPPMRRVLKLGFGGIRAEVAEALAKCPKEDTLGRKELETALVGLDTIHEIQLSFAAEAKKLLSQSNNRTIQQSNNLRRIANASERCPWEPPRTFFEGLNTLWFVREILGYVDGVNVFALGRPDAWLIDFYRREIAAGTLTEAEARELVAKFLITADCHYDGWKTLDSYNDQEAEIPLTLGGCDTEGRPVYNELTKMFLDAHFDCDCVYPKLHVRVGTNSPKAYLEHMGRMLCKGHAVFTVFNDDRLVKQFADEGFAPEDARDYIGCGCWNGYVDSMQDVDGANYVSILKLLALTIHRDPKVEAECRLDLDPIDDVKDFEELRDTVYGNYIRFLRSLMGEYARFGRSSGKVFPHPVYTMCMVGGTASRRDTTDGGLTGRQRPKELTLGFIGNVVDSLCAIDKVCFRDRVCTVREFLDAVRANWKGEKAQRLRALAMEAPYWGDNSEESVSLMSWFMRRTHEDVRGFPTDMGGTYKLAIFTYREFMYWGLRTKATPDGRYDGDRLAQGFSPSEFRCKEGATTVMNAIGRLPNECLYECNANLTFDGSVMTPELMGDILYVFAEKGSHLMQPNCNSVEELLDAQRHPERHRDLIVRVCGFSARFISLSKRWQDEVIARHRLK